MYKNSKQIAKWSLFQGWGHWEAGGGGRMPSHPWLNFFIAKRKKGKKGKKERVSTQKLLKIFHQG